MKRFLIFFSALLLAAAAASPLALTFAKQIRAQQHLTAALESKAAGDHQAAFDRLKAAHNLDPQQAAIRRLLGPYAADVQNRAALAWWLDAAESGLLDPDSIRELIAFGQQTQQFDAVAPYLQRALEQSPEDARLMELQMVALQNQMKQIEAFSIARELIIQGATSDAVRSSYLFLAFSLPQLSAGYRSESLGFLKQFAQEDSHGGLVALRILRDNIEQFSPEEQQRFAAMLQSHPQADLLDRLRALTIVANNAPEDEIITTALQLHRDNPTPESPIVRDEDATGQHPDEVLADWLNAQGFHSAAIAFLQQHKPLRSSSMEYAYTRALIGLNAFQQAEASLLDSQHLSQVRKLFLRVLIYERQDLRDDADNLLKVMADVVESSEVDWVEAVLLQRGKDQLLVAMFEHLAERLPNPFPAQMKLLSHYYRLGKARDLAALTSHIQLVDLDTFLAQKIQVLYFRILFNQGMPIVVQELERMVARFPQIIDFRYLLGLAYAQAGHGDAAAALVEGTDWQTISDETALLISAAVVEMQTGDQASVDQLRDRIRSRQLLPIEKRLLNAAGI
jgi:hypothetical protein